LLTSPPTFKVTKVTIQDRFTTNFYLPDTSYGNIFTGHYSASSGAIANLVSGDISLPNGETRNIYSDSPQAKPVTSLLPVPTPWTSIGVGTAIPDSELGAEPTYLITPAQYTITPTNSVSFPSMTSAAAPTVPPTVVNVTGIPSYSTASMGEPYGEPDGYVPPPASNTTTVEPSMGVATVNLAGGSRMVLCLMLLACLVQFVQFPTYA
jgi:hypothetical protein